MHIFDNCLEGRFVSRPNRFIAEIETDAGTVFAHCPNPGRLQEILYPGVEVILEKSSNVNRKLEYTLAAAYHDDRIAPLISLRANAIAERLVLKDLFPGAVSIERESPALSSRFDFCVHLKNSAAAYIEVKHCSLIEHGMAMFPDAPTSRGIRHIGELVSLQKSFRRTEGHIVFIITHGNPSAFSPNIHTDPDFGFVLKNAQDAGIGVHCFPFSCDSAGNIVRNSNRVPIDFSLLDAVSSGNGIDVTLFMIPKAGVPGIPGGWYAAIFRRGSANDVIRTKDISKSLPGRVLHERIPFISKAGSIKTYPVFSKGNIFSACRDSFLKRGFHDLSEKLPCGGLLYRMDRYPFHDRRFRELFFELRHLHCFI